MSVAGVNIGGTSGTNGVPGTNPAALQAAMERMQVISTNIAKYLRDNATLKGRKGLLNNSQDVEFFRYKRLIRALTSEDYTVKQKDPKNKLVPVNDEKTANEIAKLLIQTQLIYPATKLHYNEIKQTNKKWKPNKEKPTLIKSKAADFSADAYYIWNYNKPSPYTPIFAVLLVIGIFTVIFYPLWPRFMKRGVYYISMLLMCLIGVFFALAILRLIIYLVTLIAGKPFWLFPNLFADVGVIESFIPLYEWEKPKKKKSKKPHKSSLNLKQVE